MATSGQHFWRKRFSLASYGFWLGVLIGAALLLRVVLILNNWPVTNSDEATMALMAKHIARQGERPIFYYGQAYMGPIEAYVGALLVPFFGASIVTLRFSLLFFLAGFLVSMYHLTRLLYSRQLALVVVGLLSLGSKDMLLHQLRGIGGYPEIVGLGALLFLLASALARSSPVAEKARARRHKRWLMYVLWGFVAGFAVWTDQLILPWIATSGLLLVLFCHHELRRLSGLLVLLGLLVGAAPLIYYNLTAPAGENSLAVLVGLQHAGATEMAAKHIPQLRLLVGSLLYALPAITGFNPLCPVEVLPFFGPATSQTLGCSLWQGGWTVGYLALWCCAAVLAGRTLWGCWRQWQRGAGQALEVDEHYCAVLQCARLLLLLSALLTLISYTISPPAALVPGPTSRYLICLQIATPAILWPLWKGLGNLRRCRFSVPAVALYRRPRGGHAEAAPTGALGSAKRDPGYSLQQDKPFLRWSLQIAILLGIAVVLVLGTVRTLGDIPDAQSVYQQQEQLVHNLQHIGATRVYTDYWTCNLLIIQSDEQILCSNLDGNLRPALDRYPPYRDAVGDAASSTYVFRHDAIQVSTLEQELQALHMPYQRYVFRAYIVYRTARPIH